MTFHYPNGTPYQHDDPNKIKRQAPTKSKIEFGKRGMDFEEEINRSNQYYLNHGTAVIHKKPTPIQIVKVDYPRRSAAVIKEAYFRHASTTDYNGVYRGFYLDFEAKETKNKTSFPLKNFHQHQIDHMAQCLAQEGVCFVLMWFSSLNRCFFYPAETLIQQWQTLKSITLSEIESSGIEITMGIAPRIPYLEAVELYLQRRQQDGK
ncbi:recombination protein U [Enterococcus canis]|uniref:Holliday junction resolvase RecU n=1 Tax=Enterococcus canis TaxID=214095 RepID=A0A1L8RHD4_9ENTE|nr:Holliday junction resolvase RecU [Enterococcus canis]OJG19157.1 recombination protein U [Enterococcus canis]